MEVKDVFGELPTLETPRLLLRKITPTADTIKMYAVLKREWSVSA